MFPDYLSVSYDYGLTYSSNNKNTEKCNNFSKTSSGS